MNPFLMVCLVLLAVFGVLFTLEATGQSNLGLKRLWGGGEVQASNLTPVVLSSMLLNPGDQIALGHVMNVQRNGLNARLMDKEFVADRKYLAGFGELKGRVLARRKPANEAFIEADFLPLGTPPGLIGLVPEGMRLVMLPADKLRGVKALQFQNYFDLRFSAEGAEEVARVARDALDDRDFVSDEDRIRLSGISVAARQHWIAQAGMVVRAASSDRNAEVAVALHPDDVDRTLAAIEAEGVVYCIARPVAKGEVPERVVVDTVDPIEDFRWLFEGRQEVEIYEGNERSVKSVKTIP